MPWLNGLRNLKRLKRKSLLIPGIQPKISSTLSKCFCLLNTGDEHGAFYASRILNGNGGWYVESDCIQRLKALLPEEEV